MAIIKCPECGHQISEKATICPICGVEIDGKITRCVHCGEVYFKADGLCPNCHRPYRAPAVVFTDGDVDEDVDEHINEPSSTPSASARYTSNEKEPSAPTTPVVKETHQEAKEATEAPAVAAPSVEQPVSEEVTRPADNSPEKETHSESETYVQEEAFGEDEVYVEDELPIEEPESSKTKDIDTKDEFLIRTPGEDGYIDTEADEEETSSHGESTEETRPHKHNYIPLVVSLAITAVIAAICLYFYKESKMEREIQAFNVAMDSGDTEAMRDFLHNYTDATDEHKAAINEAISKITKQEEDLSLCMANRDKDALLRYVHDYPDSPYRSKILAMVDTLDWEDACKTNKKAAYDKYIAQHPDGAFIKDAREKVTVKKIEATQEDNDMARSLFREFFLSVNGNDAARLTPNLSDQITSFMSTPNPSKDDVIGWMKRQHGDGVANVIWKLNNDYKIQKREQGGTKDYTIDFTAKKTVVHSDGRATSEHYKIKSNVNGNGKISSMEMQKYTPQPSESTSSSSSSGSSTKSSSNSGSSAKQSSSGSSTKSSSNSGSSAKQSSGGSSTKSSSNSGSSSKQSSGGSSTKSSSNSGSSSKQSTGGSSTKPSSNSGSSSKQSSGGSSTKSSSNSGSSAKSSGSSAKSSGSSTKSSGSSSNASKDNKSQKKP